MESSTMSSCEESLETLTAMLNQTLVDTGRFFRASGSARSALLLKRNLPNSHEQFQSALDNLSEQIFMAKAILEKDYTAVQEKNARAKSQPAPVQKEPEPVATAVPQDQKPVPAAKPTGNQPTDRKPSTPSAIPASKEQKPTPKIKPEPLPQSQPQPVSAAAAAAPPPTEEQPTSILPPENEPINFDAMFPESGPSTSTGMDLNMNMAFNDDESANQAFLASADAMANVNNQNNGVGGGNGNNNNDSISSLLPGLESYASATGEEFNLDIPQQEVNSNNNNKDQNNAGNNGNNDNNAGVGGDANMILGESMGGGEFDNLFLDTAGFGDDDMGGMDGMGNLEIGEFDDSWL